MKISGKYLADIIMPVNERRHGGMDNQYMETGYLYQYNIDNEEWTILCHPNQQNGPKNKWGCRMVFYTMYLHIAISIQLVTA